ncbi:MAG: hypothetical protein COW67_03015 [Flavobacteriales bacterium CG18_big_fil_WC_8_21_14_2_50_32_9]|nr:MAG: hypothetical protein COW67_03015 [Flavobacteriales bacterium CG18_big_fil_WC_8_21_14_2_50_32_9]
MPFTRVWNNTTPAGTRAAKEIDDAIREFKVDVFERLSQLFVDLDVDPIELVPKFGPKATDRVIVIGPQSINSFNDEDDVTYRDNYFEGDPAGETARMRITLPVGYTLKLFEASVDKNLGTSVTADLKVVNINSGLVTSLSGPLVRSVGSIGLVTSAPLSHVIQNNEYLMAFFSGTNRYRIYGVRLTYDVPVADPPVGY